MNKEIEVYFILLNVIMNEYCILDILYRVSITFMEHLWKSDFKSQNNDRRKNYLLNCLQFEGNKI